MKTKLKSEILEILDIRDETNFSDIELFKLLDKKRKSFHPDRTTDEIVKKKYEEKVKKLNDLYKKFGEYVKAEPSASNIQLYNNEIEFDYVSVKLENDELKEKIKELENKIYFLEIDIKNKNESIKNLNDQKIKEETEKLKDVFKPKRNNLIVLGIAAILGILLHILSQTEQVVAVYMKYLPMITPTLISIITLCILLIITIIFAISYIKKIIINRWTSIVQSTEFNMKLFDYVKENIELRDDTDFEFRYSSKTYTFKERVVYNFISETFGAKTWIKRLLRKAIGLSVYSVFENFKKIVIYDLINKEIIKIYGNSGFDKLLRYND